MLVANRTIRVVGLMTLVAVLVLSGCGGGGERGVGPAEAPVAAVPEAGATPGSVGPEAEGIAEAVGAVAGVVNAGALQPRERRLDPSADDHCMDMAGDGGIVDESVVRSADGMLKGALVYVRDGLAGRRFPVPEEPVELDQKGCRYEPHVFAFRAGQTLRVRNSDATFHNVQVSTNRNKPVNKSTPSIGNSFEVTFPVPEVPLVFRCQKHPWMSAYGAVFSHPFFAVTDENGSFRLEGLPAGDHVIEVWHEKGGRLEQPVTVTADGVAEIELSY